MKKSWKKLLCSLMLAPCMFFATACGDDPEDPSNLTTDLTIEQQQEAFATLRTVASSVLNNDGTKDQSYVLENTKYQHREYDFSHSGFTGALLQDSIEITTGIAETLDSTVSYVGYKSNNTGYCLTNKELKYETDDQPTRTLVSSITKYNGQKYVNYLNDGTTKTTAYVGNDYAKKEYVADVDKISNESENYIISEMLEITNSNQSYDAYKDLIGKWAATHMYKSCATDDYSELYEQVSNMQEELDITYKLSMVDGNYVFDLKVSIRFDDIVTIPLDHLGDVLITGDVKIVFTDKEFVSFEMDYESAVTTNFIFTEGIYENHVYADGEYISGTTFRGGKVLFNFDSSFDDNFFNQSLEGYVGTGENGAVENNISNVTIYTGKDEIGVVSIKVSYGQSLKTAVMNKMNTVLHGSKYEVYEMFISEYFGELVTDSTLVPSYDIDIYMVLSDTSVEEETFVTFNIVIIDKEIEVEMTCVDFEKIKDIVKSMFALDDSDIEGIYADASMETEIPDDALVEEDKDVYVKVLDSWELPE